MRRSDPNWECSAPRSRIRGSYRYLAFGLLIAAFAMLSPAPASAQSIADIIAPGASSYGPDFKFPENKECQECRKWWVYVKGDLENLKQYDTKEWRNWYEKYVAATDAAAKLKPLQDAVEKTGNAAKGKGKNSPEAAALTKAKQDMEGPATAKKSADADLKKAADDLKNSPGTKDGLTELAKELQKNLAALKECLEKCKDKTPPPPPPPPEKKCFDTQAEKTAAIAKARKRVEAAKAALKKFYEKQDAVGHMIPPDDDDPEFQKAGKEVSDANAELDEANQAIVPCPKGGSYIPGRPGLKEGQYYASTIPGYSTPGETVSYSMPSFATDSESYCTFGEGTGVPGYVTVTDGNGVDLPPSSYGGGTDGTTPGSGPQTVSTGDPKTPPSHTPTDRPTAEITRPTDAPTPQATEPPKTASTPTPQPSDTPVATTTDKPTPQPSPSETPVATTTDTPPSQSTTDDNPPVHITIYIKANEAVLEGGQTGDPIEGQVVKLVMRDKPERPTTVTAKTAADKGFAKPTYQCTTGKGGDCKIDVAEEDRPLYALDKTPRVGGKPVNNFRLSMNVMKHNGGVAEVTGKQVPDLKNVVSQGNMTAELVKIGNRTYLRLGFNTPKEVTEDLARKLSELLGVPVEIDICLIKEPGPPLGSEPKSYSAINQELPNATIGVKLRAGRGAP